MYSGEYSKVAHCIDVGINSAEIFINDHTTVENDAAIIDGRE